MSHDKRSKHLVLVGGGHAHVQLIHDWTTWAPAGAKLTLVSEREHSPYSGMLPGYLAGWYTKDEIQFDLVKICQQAGVDFILDRAKEIQPGERRLVMASGRSLTYDVISFDIGSRPEPLAGDKESMLVMKPLAQLEDQWPPFLERLKKWPEQRPPQIGMVGGGATGVEIILLLAKLTAELRPQPQLTLWQTANLLQGHGRLARRLAAQALDKSHVRLRMGVRVCEFRKGRLHLESVDSRDGGGRGQSRSGLEPCDFLFLATPSAAPELFRASHLATDERGFLKVNEGLQSVSHPEVFGAGDCIAFPTPLPKSGVFAVREAATLRKNLRQALMGEAPAAHYRPQRRTLALITLGEKRALASWGPFAWQGRRVWKWKDRIDRRFMARFQHKKSR